MEHVNKPATGPARGCFWTCARRFCGRYEFALAPPPSCLRSSSPAANFCGKLEIPGPLHCSQRRWP